METNAVAVGEEELAIFQGMNERNDVAVYAQIENLVVFAVASGVLKPKHRLPSGRTLCELLNVNPNTVTKAYRDLELMGVVRPRKGTGVYVDSNAPAKARRIARQVVFGQVAQAVGEAKLAGLDASELTDKIARCFEACYAGYEEPPKALLK